MVLVIQHNNSDYYFHRAIRKYGYNNFKWEIITKSDDIDKLNQLEKDYILEYQSNNRKNGYNLLSGGDNFTHNKETLKKMSVNKIGSQNPFYGHNNNIKTRKTRYKTRYFDRYIYRKWRKYPKEIEYNEAKEKPRNKDKHKIPQLTVVSQ